MIDRQTDRKIDDGRTDRQKSHSLPTSSIFALLHGLSLRTSAFSNHPPRGVCSHSDAPWWTKGRWEVCLSFQCERRENWQTAGTFPSTLVLEKKHEEIEDPELCFMKVTGLGLHQGAWRSRLWSPPAIPTCSWLYWLTFLGLTRGLPNLQDMLSCILSRAALVPTLLGPIWAPNPGVIRWRFLQITAMFEHFQNPYPLF